MADTADPNDRREAAGTPATPARPARSGLVLGLLALLSGLIGFGLGTWFEDVRGARLMARARAEAEAVRRQLDVQAAETGQLESRHACERLLLDYREALAHRSDQGAEAPEGRPDPVSAAETRLVALLAKWVRLGERAPGRVELKPVDRPGQAAGVEGSVLFPDGSRRLLPEAIASQVRLIQGGPG